MQYTAFNPTFCYCSKFSLRRVNLFVRFPVSRHASLLSQAGRRKIGLTLHQGYNSNYAAFFIPPYFNACAVHELITFDLWFDHENCKLSLSTSSGSTCNVIHQSEDHKSYNYIHPLMDGEGRGVGGDGLHKYQQKLFSWETYIFLQERSVVFPFLLVLLLLLNFLEKSLGVWSACINRETYTIAQYYHRRWSLKATHNNRLIGNILFRLHMHKHWLHAPCLSTHFHLNWSYKCMCWNNQLLKKNRLYLHRSRQSIINRYWGGEVIRKGDLWKQLH